MIKSISKNLEDRFFTGYLSEQHLGLSVRVSNTFKFENENPLLNIFIFRYSTFNQTQYIEFTY